MIRGIILRFADCPDIFSHKSIIVFEFHFFTPCNEIIVESLSLFATRIFVQIFAMSRLSKKEISDEVLGIYIVCCSKRDSA